MTYTMNGSLDSAKQTWTCSQCGAVVPYSHEHVCPILTAQPSFSTATNYYISPNLEIVRLQQRVTELEEKVHKLEQLVSE